MRNCDQRPGRMENLILNLAYRAISSLYMHTFMRYSSCLLISRGVVVMKSFFDKKHGMLLHC